MPSAESQPSHYRLKSWWTRWHQAMRTAIPVCQVAWIMCDPGHSLESSDLSISPKLAHKPDPGLTLATLRSPSAVDQPNPALFSQVNHCCKCNPWAHHNLDVIQIHFSTTCHSPHHPCNRWTICSYDSNLHWVAGVSNFPQMKVVLTWVWIPGVLVRLVLCCGRE